MADPLTNWRPCPRPRKNTLEGRFCKLEGLDAQRHGDALYKAKTQDDADARFMWLPEYEPENRKSFQAWLDAAQASEDPLYFAVTDKRTQAVEGRQTLMRIDEANGVIETGHIFWSANISRTPVTTEAFYLFAHYVFDELGYRRFEWKCNDKNEPSKRAAERFGMTHEGVFRQAAVVKGKNRDTAWYAILDHEWPAMRAAFQAWLEPSNFDHHGQQIKPLREFR